MKYCRILPLALLLCAAAPTPLITGAVRDQTGAPIAGAIVRAADAVTTTSPDGTFALLTSSRTLRIECAFCRAQTFTLGEGNALAAVIVRYRALSTRDPLPEDVAAVPYAKTQTLFALHPYAVLFDSRSPLPGARVGLYGIATSLVVDNGVPSYDSATSNSVLTTVPAFDTTAVAVGDITNAPRYGNLAGGGTFALQTSGSGDTALFGSQSALRGAFALPDGFVTAALSSGGEVAQRIDAGARYQTPQFAIAVNGFVANGTGAFAGGAHAHVDVAAPLHPYLDIATGRAGYVQPAGGANAVWDDTSISAGVQSDGKIAFFSDASVHFAGAQYDYGGPALSPLGGNISQTQVDAGASEDSGPVQWQAILAAAGVEDGEYHANALTPSLGARFNFGPHWSIETSGDEAIAIPDLVERSAYGFHDALLERTMQLREGIAYTDLDRLSFESIAVQEQRTPVSPAIVAVGEYAAWQVAPLISLRAWALRFDEYGTRTVASAWLAYRAPSGVTADLLWRQDLLDLQLAHHLDASFGVPVAHGLQVFAATEERAGNRYASIGLRTQL